jgi:hypothetical protein
MQFLREVRKMKETEMRECPFCGFAGSFNKSIKLNDESWAVLHYCEPEGWGLKISISVYGNTKEEAIERWNRRATDGKAD